MTERILDGDELHDVEKWGDPNADSGAIQHAIARTGRRD
jgi:hypothetical protein